MLVIKGLNIYGILKPAFQHQGGKKKNIHARMHARVRVRTQKYSLNGWEITANSKHKTAYFQQIIWFLSPACWSISFTHPIGAIPTRKKRKVIRCTEASIDAYSMSRGYRRLKDWVMVVMVPLHYSLIQWTDLEMWLTQEVVPVRQKLWGLAELSCQWMDEVRHKARVVVVSL